MKIVSPSCSRRVVLFVALIVLIIMTLAGLALLRQMGAGTSIAGNIAFKENATSVADRGTEVARQWISDNTAITANDAKTPGLSLELDGQRRPDDLRLDRRGVAAAAPTPGFDERRPATRPGSSSSGSARRPT